MKKKEIPKDELYDLYIIENLNIMEICEKLNVSASTVSRKLKKYNIKKDKNNIIEKMFNTNIKKYGRKTKEQTKETIKKREATCLKRYGTTNPAKLKSTQEKKKQNNLEKYGVSHTSKLKSTQEKRAKTNLKKYGVKNVSQSKEVQQKKEKTFLKHYGVKNIFAREDVKEKIKRTHLRKSGTENPMFLEENKIKIEKTNMEKYGVPYFCMTDKCKKANGFTISKTNQRFSKKLKQNVVPNRLEKTIGKKSYDIEILGTNIVLEINPTYTHNSTLEVWFNKHSKKPLDKNYHIEKTLLAKENGYRCIHVFDWDDEQKIINLLKLKDNLYARYCTIKEVSKEETEDFLEKYHLQGSCRGQEIRIGLYYKDKLVQIMTFGKPRYNKKHEYELLRLCSKTEYYIVGGAQKIFKYFIELYKPKSVISYCDNSKFDGEIYRKLGFKLIDYGKPSKHWYNAKIKKHITDNLLRQRGFDQLFKTSFGKGTSNKELMIKNGFVEVYDCGQSTYVYNTEE